LDTHALIAARSRSLHYQSSTPSHIRGSHTYKAGGEWKIDTFSNISRSGLAPALNFSNTQTAQPLYGTTNLPGGTSIGSGYASFLLGYFDSASIGNESAPQYRRSSWGFFVQDTWKVNRKLTLDIGMRYDLQKPERELWGRQASFRPDVTNPKVGRPGGILISRCSGEYQAAACF